MAMTDVDASSYTGRLTVQVGWLGVMVFSAVLLYIHQMTQLNFHDDSFRVLSLCKELVS